MKLTLRFPPYNNRFYRNFGGRMVMSKEGRDYKAATLALAQMRKLVPLEGFVKVEITAYRPRKAGDLDGIFKCVLDALQGVAYANDKQIIEIHAFRRDDKHNPRVEIEITPQELPA